MRLYVPRKGKARLIERCIECPKMSTCEAGAWRNYRPASGPIPLECKLPAATERQIERMSS